MLALRDSVICTTDPAPRMAGGVGEIRGTAYNCPARTGYPMCADLRSARKQKGCLVPFEAGSRSGIGRGDLLFGKPRKQRQKLSA